MYIGNKGNKLVIEDNGNIFGLKRGKQMLTHVDLIYLVPDDPRIILFRYMPQKLRVNNKKLLTSFNSLQIKVHDEVAKTKRNVKKKKGTALIFPCQKFTNLPYKAVKSAFLEKVLQLQEEINLKIALLPSFKGPLSKKSFSSIIGKFNKVLSSSTALSTNEKLKGAILPQKFLDYKNSLHILGESGLDFFFLNAWGTNSKNLPKFYSRLNKLLKLENPVFVIDAVLFAGTTQFARNLSGTGISGFSLPYIDFLIPKGYTYYDVSNGSPTRHKDHGTMVNQHGSDTFPLSSICPCTICDSNTIGSFFQGSKVPEKNRLHRLEFADK